MRLIKYLNDSIDLNFHLNKTPTQEKLDDYISLIKQNCKPFLKDWNSAKSDSFLYSGRNISQDFGHRKVRKDRKPLDTPLEIHNYLDDWFYKKFKIRARSNAVFVTGSYSVASTYGHSVYYIFPIGKYTMISSKIIHDLFGELKRNIDSYFNINIRRDEFDIDVIKPIIDETLNDGKYEKIKKILNSEIMLHCDKYYYLKESLITEIELIRQLRTW